jgi:transcriptional regulator with GAF, ATPase, and Fis domain
MPFGPNEEAATEVQTPQHVHVSGTYRLVVVEGPDRGAELLLDGTQSNRVLIGQGGSSDLRLSDPTVSRRHAALDLGESGLRLVDLDSRNGTFVSGVRIEGAMLEGGEMVRVGNSVIRVDAVAAAHAVPLSSARSFGNVVGASIEMRRLYPLCERIAASDVPVVIEGPTGTGKEVLAESIHDASARARGPFVVFDCTAVPPNLVESELFGHERGAFTGAVAQRKGVFEQAHGGTLLIDEIGDLETALQPKLLRVIQRSEVKRVGASGAPIKVDVRVMAATRRDLDREVQDGRFRDDLYYRLAVARIELPPLRARKGDIAVLATHFWHEMGGEDDPPYELLRRFERYSWPGNVRELANAVARHLALGDFAPAGEGTTDVSSGDLVESVLGLELPFPRARDRVLAEFERRYVERMLARHGGNVAKAAQASGIGRRYFAMIASRHAK